ncbi:MAG: DUF3750 domain-containing protein [Acetobacteraceae bacterium]|nr:DUF3750 domain-containing protein [Acetobacteraceae bacterium]
MISAKLSLLLFAAIVLAPLSISAIAYYADGSGPNWQLADRSSAGLLSPAAAHNAAVVRIFAARTVRWRGIFAVHCWIVYKAEDARAYTRYDYTAWGEPIRRNGFEPDGRWFGRKPDIVFAADGAVADRLVPKIDAAVAAYRLRDQGDYHAWPGPNSNTFIAAVLDAVPDIIASLPPTAIGKDYPYDGRWFRMTSSGTGLKSSLGGYLGLTIGWVEGIEVNFLGGVVGIDIRRPALKLPGVGRIGMAATT